MRGGCTGRTERIRLGGVEITIEQAYKMAAKRALRESETVQELFDRYTAELKSRVASERSLITDKPRFSTCLDGLASRRVLSIREVDVRQLHGKIAGG